MSVTVKRQTRSIRIDAACVEAVDLARETAAEVARPDDLGDHLGCDADGERVVTHYFACTNPAYVGWRWAVTLARAPRQRNVTVDEVVLLPGPDARLAPEWLPWSDRVRPDDLGPGDLLPTPSDDPRLVPGYTGADEDPDPEATRSVVDELGLGRVRVLSPEGRDDAADRWYTGKSGPDDPVAQSAPARCATCGFLMRVSGPVGQLFGVCANEFSPSDGEVVALDHGCGAHSEAMPAEPQGPVDGGVEPVLDTLGYDDVEPV